MRGAPAYDGGAVRRYQDRRWGRVDGDTTVLELSAITGQLVPAVKVTHPAD
jgi:hypothetical protein